MLQSKAFPQLHTRLGTSANTHSIKYTAPSRWDLHNCDTEGIKKNRLLGLGAITEMSARKGSKLGAGSRLQRLLSPGLCVPSIALLCAHRQVPSSKQPKSFPCPPFSSPIPYVIRRKIHRETSGESWGFPSGGSDFWMCAAGCCSEAVGCSAAPSKGAQEMA